MPLIAGLPIDEMDMPVKIGDAPEECAIFIGIDIGNIGLPLLIMLPVP